MKILSMNGGGTCGYRTAKFLQYMEQELNTPCWTQFDMIVGLSAGSINGGMLAKKAPAKYLVEQFREYCPKIFGNPRSMFKRIFWESQFDNSELINLTKNNMDFDISECAVKTMIYSLCITGTDTIRPKFWKSWEDKNVKMYDAVMASSSAPSMFPPYDIVEDGVRKSYTDGGIISNNPSMSALVEAVKLGNKLEDIYILNISNGNMPSIEYGKFTTLYNVATKLGFVTISAAERSTEYQCHQLIGFNNHVVTPPKYIPSTSLDFDTMDEQAKIMWDNHKSAIIDNLAK
jgi:patatin-like phospholipase/acyl hydrolase